ncbi:hypothetical protein BHM03_00050368 [Ensete ventricosum]|nr:hypothetical protein BHM03_00050368 [Ensete ventricosum]
MGSVSSEEAEEVYASDQPSDGGDSHSPSSKVPGSDSSIDFSGRRFPVAGVPLLPGGDVLFWEANVEERATDISAAVFGELWRLEPLAPQKKTMWRREMDWLLSVSDYIVELVPSIQELPGGRSFEVMVSCRRNDLQMNLPALKKLDTMLLGMLDGFLNTEFWYVDRGFLVADADEDASKTCPSSSFRRASSRQEEKWWLPCPGVPPTGLSEEARKRLQLSRDCANQILKAALAINSAVLSEMETPDVYFETLPKFITSHYARVSSFFFNCDELQYGKTCLGDIIYRYITADSFSPECLLDCLELSSEHHILEIANRIEAAIHVWRLKGQSKQSQSKAKNSWSGRVIGLVGDTERFLFLAERGEGLLQSLQLRYPALPHTILDMNKIQYNKDVGHSILESYSRVMESLAFNIVARIDDLIFVDDATKNCAAPESISILNRGGMGGIPIHKRISPSPFSFQNTPSTSPFCSSTPLIGSPVTVPSSLSKGILQEQQEGKVERLISGNTNEVWSYTKGLCSRKDAGDAPERN